MTTTQRQAASSCKWTWFNLDLLKEAIREEFGVEPRIEVISSNAVRAEFDDYRLYIQCFKECKGCQASLYFKGREVTMCKIKCYDFENNEERAKKVTTVLKKANVPAEYGLSWTF